MAFNRIVSGIHAVEALLKSRPQAISRVLLTEGRHSRRLGAVKSKLESAKVPFVTLSASELDARAGGGKHQGIVAELVKGAESGKLTLEDVLASSDSPFVLILDGVQDPHNLGACLRTAEATGVDAIVIPRRGAVGVTDAVRRVAAGAAESVPVVAVSNLTRSLEQLKQAGVWIWGTSENSDVSLWDADLTGPVALVLGSEGDGMRSLTQKNCDHTLSIPMSGEIPSLNVSVAAGVVLFEAVRQRRGGR